MLFRFLTYFLVLFGFQTFAKTSKVLVVGDSQSMGSFGPRLLKTLEAWGFSTSYYARSGAVADWYLSGVQPPKEFSYWDAPFGQWSTRKSRGATSTPTLISLVKKHRPKLVIVQLGGNMHFQKDEEIQKSTMSVLSIISEASASCLWVGPPPGEKRPQPRFDEFYKNLQSIVESDGCRFLDSRKVFKGTPRGGDGIHLDTMFDGMSLSKGWTSFVANEAKKILSPKP